MSEYRRRCVELHIFQVARPHRLMRGVLANTDTYTPRARRNAQGHLEPDAADDVIQKSLGFDSYEHAPRVEAQS